MRALLTPVLLSLVLGGCAADAATNSITPTIPAVGDAAVFPDVIALPNGFASDGISFGAGSTFYVGSLATGAIWRGNARTGTGGVVVQPQAGRSACGVEYDAATNRIFVAGSFTGQAYVYDAATGATLATYQLSDPGAGPTNIQGVAVLRDAVYFTDLLRPVMYRIPLGPGGALPPQSAVQVLPYSGDFQFVPDNLNSSGIVATPDQHWLIMVNVTTGALYRVDPATAATTAIGMGGATVPSGDGLAFVGRTLYVSQVALNQIASVQLDADYTIGAVSGAPLHNPALDFPAKIAVFGNALYAVNARFEVEPGPNVAYQVVRVER